MCKKNIGASYSVELMQTMNIPLPLKFQERVKCINEAMRKRSLSTKLKPAKKRRIELKQKQKQRDVALVKEGDTYESGVQLRNEENIDHEIIPSFSPLPVEEPTEPKDNIIFISVYRCRDNIVELSASYNNHFFDQYVLPKHGVREKSSQITSLRKIGNVLLYKGSLVKTVEMRECAKLFINWLDSIDGEKILYGYNAKGCDVRMICKDFREVNMEKELTERILGFCDTLPLLRRLYPNQKSHSQLRLCKAMIGYSYTAHNSLQDAKALEKLLTTLRIGEQDMVTNSISIDLAFKKDVC